MNLEELKIKVSLDLKDLNKQLNGISTSINKTFTSSVKKMSKTTTKEVNIMAKDINKSLNKAFTLDSRKFDADVNRTMNQAKRTVRSACKEIRTELNKAFNIDGHIRVTASSNSKINNSGSNNSNTAIAASSQYTGAMIIKATNAIIAAITANNNANTQQTISAIDRSTNRIIKALSATSTTYKKIPIKPTPNNSKPTTQGVLVGNPYGPNTKAVAEALKNATKVANIINKNLSKAMGSKQLGTGSYGSNNMQGGTVNWRAGKKQSTTTSFEGQIVNPVVPTIPVEPFKQIQDIIEVINFEVKDFETGLVKAGSKAATVFKSLKEPPLTGEVIDPEVISGPLQQFKEVKKIIEDVTYRVLDLEKALMNTSNFDLGKEGFIDESQVKAMRDVHDLMMKIKSLSKGLVSDTTSFTMGAEGSQSLTGKVIDSESIEEEIKGITQKEIIIPASFKVIDDELKEQVEKTIDRIKRLNLDIPISTTLPRLNEPDNSNPQLPELSSLQLPTIYEDLSLEAIDRLPASLEKARKIMMALIQTTGKLAQELKESASNATQLSRVSKPQRPDWFEGSEVTEVTFPKQRPQRPEGFEGTEVTEVTLPEDTDFVINSDDAIDEFIKNVNDAIKQVNKEFQKVDGEYIESSINKINDSLDSTANKLLDILEKLKKFGERFGALGKDSKNTIPKGHMNVLLNDIDKIKDSDFSNIIKQINKLRDNIEDIADTSGVDKLKSKLEALQNARVNVRKAVKSGVYDDASVEMATRMIKDADNVKYGEPSPGSLGFVAFSMDDFDDLVNAAKKAGEKIKTSFSKAFSKVKGIIKKLNLGDLGKNLDAHVVTHKVGIIKDALEKLKKSFKGVSDALKSFANKAKTIWSKITGIFKKGAKESASSVNSMTLGLKDLVKTGISAFSLYKLVELAKQAATASTEQASSELRLVAALKQRMNATDDTIQSVRNLISAQSQIGVLGKDVITMGAQQLATYTKSAEALEALIPRMNNLLVRQEGFNASIEQAQEMAVRLGEALAENSLEPLRSADIPITDAEVETFKKLRTEEQKVAYLTALIDERVGNLNQALAQTPYGAIQQLKNNFNSLLGTLGMIIVNAIQPLVQWLNVIVVACNNALTALAKLFGFSFEGAGFADSLSGGVNTGGVDGATDSFKDAADAANEATKANEEFKGSLAGFDEINTLSDNTSKDSDSEGGLDVPSTPGIDIGTLTPTDDGAFDILSDKMKAFLDEVLEPFKNAWDSLGDRWKTAWADLQASFKNFCDSLATFLKSVWDNGGKEFVEHMAEIALAVGIAAMEIGGTILDALAKLWEHLDPSTNMNTQGFIDALNEVSQQLRDFILGLNGHLESLLQHGGQDVLNAMGDMFMNLGEAAVRGFGLVIQALDDLIDHLDPATNEITQGALKTWEEAFSSVGQAALSFADLLESTLENGGQAFINSLGDLGMQVVEFGGVLVREGGDALNNFFKHLDPATNSVSKGALDSFKYFTDSITGFVDMLGNSLSLFMDKGGQTFFNNVGDIISLIATLAATIGGDIINAVTAFFDSWAGQLVIEAAARVLEVISGVLKGLLEILQPLTPIISGVVAAIGGFIVAEKVVTFITGIVTAFQSLGGASGILSLVSGGFSGLWAILAANPIAATVAAIAGIATALVAAYNKCDWFRDAVDKVLARVKESFEGLKETISSILEHVAGIFQNVIDIIVGIFTGDGERVGTAVRELIGNVIGIFKGLWDLRKDLAEIGFNLIVGLCEGVWECIKNIPQLLAGIADFVIDFFVGLFGLDSSTGEQIKQAGRDMVSNMCQGVKDAISAVGDAFGAVKDAVVKGIDNITSGEWWSKIGETMKKPFVDAKDSISETFSNMSSSIGEWWDDIKNTTSEKCENVKNSAVDLFGGMASSVSETLGEFARTTGDKWNEIKDVASERLDIASKNASEKWQDLTDSLSDILSDFIERNKERWERIKKTTAEKVNPIMDDVIDKYTNMKDSACETLDEWMAISEQKWAEHKEKIMSKVQPVIDGIVGAYEGAKNHIANAWDETVEYAKDTWKETEDFYNTHKGHLEEKMTAFANHVKHAWDETVVYAKDTWAETEDFYNTHKQHLEEKMTAFGNHVKNAWDETVDYAKDVWKETEDFYNTHKTHLEEKMTAFGNHVKNAWDETVVYAKDVWAETEDFFATHKQHLEEKMTAIGNHFKNAWDETVDYAKDVWSETEDFFGTHKSHLEEKMSAIGNHFKNAWDETVIYAKDVWAETEDWFGTHKGHLEDKMSSLSEFFRDKWNVIGSGIKEGIASGFEGITDFIADKFGPVVDWFKDLGLKIVDTFAFIPAMWKDLFGIDVFQAIKDGLNEGLDKLLSIKDFANKAISIGQFLIEGLCDGIATSIKAMGTFVKGMGDIVIGFFKDIFGIHSPSKVFAELGEFLIEGLVEGITGMISKATKAISDLGKAMMNGAKDIVKDTVAKFKEIKDGVTEKLKETKENASQKWKEMKENASDYCSQLVEVSQNKFSSVKDKLTKVLEDTNKSVSTKWEDIKKTTTEKCKNIYDDVKTKYTDAKNTIGDILVKTKEEASTKWDAVKTTTIDIISKMKDNASSNYDKLRENLGNTVTKWSENSRKTWETIKENTSTITSNLKDNASKTYEELQTKVSDTLNKWSETSKNTWDTIKENTSTTVSNLKDSVSENYEKTRTNIANSLEKTKENVSSTWENVKTTTGDKIKQAIETASNSYNTMKETIGSKLEEVKSKTATKWSEMNSDTQTKVSDIVKNAGTKFGEIKNSFTQKLTDAKTAMSSKWNDLKTQGYDSAKGIVDKAKSGLSNMGQTMADAISKGKSKVSSALDEIGKIFKNAKWELPKIKLPSIKITGDWSLKPPYSFPKFSIQWNKRGGIIDGITPLGFANGALQMGGEAGKEMVVPLENTSFTSKIAQAMGQAVDNAMRRSYNNTNNNNSGVNDNRDVVLKIDGREFARTSINQINKLQRESGKTLLDV